MGTRNNVNANRKWLRQKNNEAKTKDELNYEELKEFAQEGTNRLCFDCHQRGPTYVNMTIGSFVCMRCSGLLRGLTPPHRVKSMSMATFTPEEVQYIKERGNDYCKQVWLALHENNTAFTQSTDEQDIKDFMMQKYERKRYYVDPNVAGITLRSVTPTTTENHNHITNNYNNNNAIKFTKVKPPSSNSSNSSITLFESPKSQDDDFIADFSKADIFIASPPPPPPSLSQSHIKVNGFNPNNVNNNHISNESFANFENNPIFNATATPAAPGIQVKPVVSKLSTQLTSPPAPPPPPEDRYAALKDLDDAFKNIQQQQVEPTQPQQSDWMFVSNNSPHQGSFESSSSSFQDIWNPFSNAPTPMTMPVMPNVTSVFNANPFRAFNGNQISSAPSGGVNINPFKMNMASNSSSTTYSNNPFL